MTPEQFSFEFLQEGETTPAFEPDAPERTEQVSPRDEVGSYTAPSEEEVRRMKDFLAGKHPGKRSAKKSRR